MFPIYACTPTTIMARAVYKPLSDTPIGSSFGHAVSRPPRIRALRGTQHGSADGGDPVTGQGSRPLRSSGGQRACCRAQLRYLAPETQASASYCPGFCEGRIDRTFHIPREAFARYTSNRYVCTIATRTCTCWPWKNKSGAYARLQSYDCSARADEADNWHMAHVRAHVVKLGFSRIDSVDHALS